MLQARIKPHDPTRGHLVRGMTIEALGMSFDEGKVYDVNEATAAVLREQRARPLDPSSPLAFDVFDADTMKKTIANETKARLGITPEMAQALREDLDSPTPSATTRPQRRRGGGQ